MSYTVDVQLGATTWAFELDDDGDLADGYTILSGLNFGWSMPGGIWPVQPNPQGLSLTLNVPNFGVPDVNNGDRVSVVLSTGIHTPAIASFYGKVSDLKAKARHRTRPGVFIDVTAVELGVDLAERDPHDFAFPAIVTSDLSLIEDVMDEVGGTTAAGIIAANGIPPIDTWPPDGPVNARDLLDQLLLQAVKPNDRRLIWSPAVGVYPAWEPTLDPVFAQPEHGLGDPFVIPGSAVDLDTATWSNVKGASPDGVYATGWGNDPANIVKSIGATTGDIFASIASTFDDEADAADAADFYVSPFAKWQVDRFTVHASRAGYEIPIGLFPDWSIAPGDATRSTCYNAWIEVEDVDTTRTPDGLDVVAGVLTGAQITIDNGSVSMDLTIRRPASLTPGEIATFTIAAGEVASDLTGFVTRLDLHDIVNTGWWDALSGEADQAGCLRAYLGPDELPIDVTRVNAGALTGEVFVRSNILAAVNNRIELKVVAFATAYATTDPLGRNAVWDDYEAALVASADFANGLTVPVDRTGNTSPAFGTGGTPPTLSADGVTFGATASRGLVVPGVALGTAFTMACRAKQNVNDATHRALMSYGANSTDDTKRATLLGAGSTPLYSEVTKNTNSSGSYGDWDWTVTVAAPITITRFQQLARVAGNYSVYFNGTLIGSQVTAAPDVVIDITLATPYVASVGSLLIRVDPVVGSSTYFRNGTPPAATSGTGTAAITGFNGLRAPGGAGSPATNAAGYGRLDFYVTGSGAIGHFYLTNSTDGSLDVAAPTVATDLNAWHRWNAMHNGTTERVVFHDGAEVAVDAGCAARPGSGADTLFLGIEDTSQANPWRGYLDYAYLRLTALSDDWIAAEHVSWDTPSSFYTVT